MSIFRSAACTASLLASAALIASPVAAATRTVPITVPLSARPAQAPAWSSADETFNEHRWRGHRRHHDGFDGGDLLTVLLIGGGIAAVASAIGNDQEQRRADRTDGRDYPDADAAWLSTVIASGGCNGNLTNNSQGAPSACGGSRTVTFTYTSTCAPLTSSVQATFTVPNSPAVVLTAPTNTTTAACLTQEAVNSAYAAWLSTVISSGGCNGR